MSGSGEVPVGFRFKADGIDDTIDRIKQLHSELNSGQITTREYRTGMREVTTETHAATQEFNQIKGAIYAANPTLLEFTKTMSGFSAVAQTGLSITNAINLALLATQGTSNQLQDLKTKLADARLEYERFANSPQFGPASPQAQAALSKIQELTNQYNNTLQQWYIQQITNDITLASSVILTINQITQLSTTLRTLAASMDPIIAENFAIGLTGIGGALLTWLGPIALVIAGVEGIYQVIKLLDPAFAETSNNLENAIMKNWHVDAIEATLLAPFVGFAGGVVQAADEIYSVLVNLYNQIVSNVLNPLINSWDSSLGNILGKINQLGTVTYSVQSANQILQGFGLGSNALGNGSSLPQNPGASSVNSLLLTGQMKDSVDTQKQTLDTQKISQQLLSNMTSTSAMMNNALNMINNSTATSAVVAQQQLQATQEQKANIDALKQSIIDNTNKIMELQKQPQTQSQIFHTDPDTGLPTDIRQVATDAANQIQTLQQQNAQAAQIIASASTTVGGLDNSVVGLGPVLSSLGLDPNTGIGSIVSGALGGYAGIGGAGTSAGDIANFAATGDYGVFTKNAITEGMPKVPTQQDQINAWLNAVNGKGMGTFTAADASKALNLPGSGSSSGSSNVGSGQFGGLPGQYGNPIAAATGFDGMVSGPTYFLAGESGPEFVNISPTGKGGRSSSVNVTVNVVGSVLSDYDLKNTLQSVLKDILKSSGFT